MIILYGGAFDPPHNGHTQSVDAVAKAHPEATILIVPGRQPAGASGQHKSPSASFEHRLAMCKMAFCATNSPQRIVSAIEAEITPPNYTIKTLEKIRSIYPNESIALMIGLDQLMKFPFWHEPKGILDLCSLIVVKRSGRLTEKTELVTEAERAAYLLDIKLHWTKAGVSGEFLDLATHIELLDVDLCEAESSAIRVAIAEKRPVAEGWLSPKIEHYIKTHQLYA